MSISRQPARLSTAVFGLAIAGLTFASCARNPVTGRPEAVIMTEEAEIKQGREASEEVEQAMGLVDDPALNAYVNEIGQRLAAHSPRQNIEHHFYVVEMAEPNAFALPGGYIYISRGLLSLVNSEDELANVIGHEIGHVAARHSVSRQTANAPLIPVKILANIGGAAASIVSPTIGGLVSGVGQLPGAVALATYSRSQEKEADEIGQRLAAAAGWDPIGMSTFMHTLAREAELAGGDPSRASFLASHPASPTRSKDTKKYATKLEIVAAKPIAADHASFLGRLAGIVVGDRASEGVFVDEQFLQPDLDFALTLPTGWNYINSRAAVVAEATDKNAYVIVEVAAEGDDAMKVAKELAAKNRLSIEPRRRTINGLDAVEASTQVGSGRDKKALQLTWIASGGNVYQVTGLTRSHMFNDLQPRFITVARTFHTLTAAERRSIHENRLRVIAARANESLETLGERAENQWSPEQSAVANGLELGDTLTSGAPIKIAHRERYEP